MLILLLLGLLLAFLLQRIIYEKNWKKRLDVTLKFQDSWIYEGEKSALKEVVKNDKLLPIPALEVGIAMSRNLRFDKGAEANSNVTDQSYKRDIFSFLFHQQITRTLPFEAKKRGIYQIENARIVAYDLFFKNNYYEEYAKQTSIYVYPRQVDTRRIQMVCQALSGMVLSRNCLYEDPFEFAGIREYRKEDPMNRINWKTSARAGELMVNQFDSTTNIEVTILLDVKDDDILKEEELIEDSIRIVSSLTGRLVKAKMEVQVRSNALDKETKEKLEEHLTAGAGRCAVLNRKLAGLETEEAVETGMKVLEEEIKHQKKNQTYVVISKNQSSEMQVAVQKLSKAGSPVLWVVPFYSDTEFLVSSKYLVSVIGWEVNR